VARVDEGDDICADAGFGQATTGVGIPRRKQQRENVARRLAARFENRAAAPDDRLDRLDEGTLSAAMRQRTPL